MVEVGPVSLAPLGDEDVPRLRALMAKYRDQPMDLADAALVHVAERDGYRRILTLDERHFATYRIGGRERFTVLPGRVAAGRAGAARRRSRSGS
jgi:predicted nucleic acid-binding protein